MDFPAWDPVLFDIPWLPDVRWYGVMYIVGFVIGQWLLVRMARAGFFPVKPEAAGDLVFYCVFGVMIGGRTGYALFYQHDLLNPLQFVQVWKGGLAFHGGLGGVAFAVWLFCRKHKISWRRTVDACCIAVTPGIFAVRFANFLNGELYGRVTTKGVGWAMQFPTDPMATRLLGLSGGWSMRDRELCVQVAFGKRSFESVRGLLSDVDEHGRTIDWNRVGATIEGAWANVRTMTDVDGTLLVPYRHPSQLYEGFGEGLVLGLLLFAIYRLTRRRPWPPGFYAAAFLIGYGVIRWSLELVRQPDEIFGAKGTVLVGMTMGQTLSVGLLLGAVLLVFWPRRPPATTSPNGG